MAATRVFKSGNRQAVRLPKEFRFSTDEVEIFRRGDEVILREVPQSMQRVIELLAGLPDDVLTEEPDDPPPVNRNGV